MSANRARFIGAILLLASATALSGCGGMNILKKFTGQRDDTVLPGERETILTPDQTRSADPNLKKSGSGEAGAPSTNCDPDIQDCSTGVNQEADGGFDG